MSSKSSTLLLALLLMLFILLELGYCAKKERIPPDLHEDLDQLKKEINRYRLLRGTAYYTKQFLQCTWPLFSIAGLIYLNLYIAALHQGRELAKAKFYRQMVEGEGGDGRGGDLVNDLNSVTAMKNATTTEEEVDTGYSLILVSILLLIVMFAIVAVLLYKNGYIFKMDDQRSKPLLTATKRATDQTSRDDQNLDKTNQSDEGKSQTGQ